MQNFKTHHPKLELNIKIDKIRIEDYASFFPLVRSLMKEDLSNIFEHAAQHSPKKKPVPSVSPKTSAASDEFSPFTEKKESSDPLSDEKVQELLKKINDIHKEIETKLESVYERSDLSPQKLDTYLEMFNETGYTLAQLKEVHKEQKKLEERIAKAFGGGKTLAQTHKEHEQVKASKERHSKSLGARKQWIPMK